MSKLRQILDHIKPNFEKDGKLSFLHSSFEAIETLLYVPGHNTQGGTHIKDGIDMKRMMITVVVALLPATLFGIWNVGYQHYSALGEASTLMGNVLYGTLQVLPILVVSYMVGLGIEFAYAQKRGHSVNEGFLVSGFLIPLVLPPTIPLWMVAVGTAFAVIFAKEVFGGTGMNILNPALAARAFLYISYPGSMTGNSIWVAGVDGQKTIDGFTGATMLGDLREAIVPEMSIFDSFIGMVPGSIGETSMIAILIGAIILIASGVGSIKVMGSVFAGGIAMALIVNLLAPADSIYMNFSALHHVCIGGFAFGAVFMATDPVSAAQTEKGKIIYGLLIGAITILVRLFGGWPEGIMLVILLMNVLAPAIDHFVVQKNIKRRLNRVKI